MTQAPCAIDSCDRPVPDTCFVCPGCGDRLRRLLTAVPDHTVPAPVIHDHDAFGQPRSRRAIDGGTRLPGIASALNDAVLRQVRYGAAGGGRSSDAPRLLYHPQASSDAWALRNALAVWARLVAGQRGLAAPGLGVDELSLFLAGQVDWLRAQAAGAQAIDELTAALLNAQRAGDRPADRQYAGPCTATVPDEDGLATACGVDLYARPGADTVECRVCGTAYPLADRRAWLLRQAEDMLLTAPDIARAVDGLGVQVSPKTVESWVRRGQLVARGRTVLPDGRTAATYRVGDVLDRVHAAATRRRLVAV